jgi:hypothetical protein
METAVVAAVGDTGDDGPYQGSAEASTPASDPS